MNDFVKSAEIEIHYQGRKVPLHVMQGEDVGNDWTQYSISCQDGTFEDVFNQNPILLQVKANLTYQPDNDLEDRTPEQTILVSSTWNEIQRLFY